MSYSLCITADKGSNDPTLTGEKERAIMARRDLTNKDLNNFNTDRMTLVLAFLWFKVRQDNSIFDYDFSYYQKVDAELQYGVVTSSEGEDSISVCYPKGELRLSKDDIAYMERKRSLNMMVRPSEPDLTDFL